MRKLILIFVLALVATAFTNVTFANDTWQHKKVPKIEHVNYVSVDFTNVENEFNYTVAPVDVLANRFVTKSLSINTPKSENINLIDKETAREIDSGIITCSVINFYIKNIYNCLTAKTNFTELYIASWCNRSNRSNMYNCQKAKTELPGLHIFAYCNRNLNC